MSHFTSCSCHLEHHSSPEHPSLLSASRLGLETLSKASCQQPTYEVMLLQLGTRHFLVECRHASLCGWCIFKNKFNEAMSLWKEPKVPAAGTGPGRGGRNARGRAAKNEPHSLALASVALNGNPDAKCPICTMPIRQKPRPFYFYGS